MLTELDEMSEEERREFLELVDRWNKDGMFVFWWAEDYFIDRDGEVC